MTRIFILEYLAANLLSMLGLGLNHKLPSLHRGWQQKQPMATAAIVLIASYGTAKTTPCDVTLIVELCVPTYLA